MTPAILPGSPLGVLGSGQLGRMFAISARRMGYRVHTFSPDTDTPTGQVADLEVTAPYENLDAVRTFAKGVSVVTFEFENVPFATASAAAELAPVRPGGHVLHTTQHRLREKTFLKSNGFPHAPFERVTSQAELAAAIQKLGTPCILKTAGWGYDGKGQYKISSPSDAPKAWATVDTDEAVLEAYVHFEKEASVICARRPNGDFAHYGLIENLHANHVLDLSISPARLPPKIRNEAVGLARAICEAVDLHGVLCVELFITHGGGLLVNELAPRPHNSGHLTFDFNETSQFEQQLRAVCNLPLGGTAQLAPHAAMAQLLGDLWQQGEPHWEAALADPRIKLHLYGKREARPGRKMGHLTATGSTAEDALRAVQNARAALTVR